MKKITVLIPTLNSIQFIKECLKSVINQTLKELEIIIIDAGSTDGTLELVEMYQKVDDRIQIVHSEVKSYGYQLNMGIELAKGDYIGVVESDDIIEKDMYETLLAEAEEKDADFVKGNFYHYAVTDDEQELVVPEPSVPREILGNVVDPSEYQDIYFLDFYLWRGIYKREFINKNKIVFHESKGAAYQDIGFLFQVFTNAQKVVYLDKCFYKYRRNNSGSSTYNSRAFSYLAGEYAYILDKLNAGREIDEKWASVFYKKMFVQCRSRIRLLAYNDADIKSGESDILYLQRILRLAYHENKFNISTWNMALQIEFQMFINDIRGYVSYYQIQVSTKKAYISRVMNELKACSEVFLIGDSKQLPFIYALLRANNIKTVVNIADNDKSKCGKKRMGIEIVSVESVCEETDNRAYLVCSMGGLKELTRQLIACGVKENQVYAFDLGIDWLLLS